MTNSPGHWVALDTDGSGAHVCMSSYVTYTTPEPTLKPVRVLESRNTYPRGCWWCGEPVFFHSNGSGDCVLFDYPLGPPWPIHTCWQEHCEDSKTRDYLIALTPREPPQVAASQSGLNPVSVSGMVRATSKKTTIDVRRWSAKSDTWRIAEIEGKESTFEVLMPAGFSIAEGDMVSVNATWLQWSGSGPDQWLLIARECKGRWRDGEDLGGQVFVRSREKGHCHWCGLQLRNVPDWHVSSEGLFECQGCVAMKAIVTGDIDERLAALPLLLGQLSPNSCDQAKVGPFRALDRILDSLSHKPP